jgi:hypothetical protein
VPTAVGAGGPEVVAMALVLLLGLTAALGLTGSWSVFTRHLWYDEGLTQEIVADPDLGHALAALMGGVETHPPAYYLALRGFAAIAGRANEVVLRSFAFLCTILALTGVYATLRLTYAPLTAFAAVLALCAHPLLLHHAFEARHYNLVAAELAWLCYFLARARLPGTRAWVGASAVLVAVLAAATHYLAIIGVTLVLAGDLAVSFRCATANRLRALALAAAGLTCVACLPMIRSQRAALTVPTFLQLPDRAGLVRVFELLFTPAYLIVGLGAVAAVALFWRGRRRPARAPLTRRGPWYPAGLAAMALFPVALLVMSYIVQPMFGPRYVMPAVISLAPLVALVCTRAPRWSVVALCAFFALITGGRLASMAEEYRDRDRGWDDFIGFLRTNCPGDAPIVFHTNIQLSFVSRYAPDLAPRCFQLDYEREDLEEGEPFLFNRDLARRQAAYYGRPALLRCDAAKRALVYLVLNATDPPPTPRFRPFADGRQRDLGRGVVEMRFPQPEADGGRPSRGRQYARHGEPPGLPRRDQPAGSLIPSGGHQPQRRQPSR